VTGSWDLLATSPGGAPTTGTLSIASNALSISIGTDQIDYAGATSSVSRALDGTTGVVGVARNPAALSTGILAIQASGASTFSMQGSFVDCYASLSPTSWSGSCDGYPYEWPYGAIPYPEPDVTYTATRTQQLSSVFGDLGGVWAATVGPGGPPHCTATFQGSTFSASCQDGDPWSDGSVTLTFCGVDTASGTTGDGFELSAHKQ
jgi:hypothetical protein